MFIICSAACATTQQATESRPLLHPLFNDSGVLQRERPVAVWGWAKAGTEVTVRFANQSRKTIAGPEGKWSCTLEPLAASNEGRTLTVETNVPGVRAEAHDILVGDVWLCSGQSNMEMGIGACNEEEEITRANYPRIRLLTVKKDTAFEPQDSTAAEWKLCTPDNLREGGWGGFSAAAYFFGKKIHEELDVPIGLIHSSWGGTFAEAWTSEAALEDFPEFAPQLKQVEAIASSTAEDPELEYLNTWFQKHDPGTRSNWQRADADTSDWREVSMPGSWSDCGIPGFEGVVWLQRKIELPDNWADKALTLRIGEIADNDTTWLNGTIVGRTNQYSLPRRYEISAGIAQPGINTITLRITNAGGGGILAEQYPLSIYPTGEEAASIPLAGKWHLKETAKKDDTGRPLIGNPRVCSVLYNGMIAPLLPYTMTGVIWYQGEANASRPEQYQRLLPAMIRDWRKRFQREDLAFHIVSLASYQNRAEQPRDNEWAELREAQATTAKSLPHCELAIAIDIGEADDIHPKNKRDVGKRLALSALANTYGKAVVGSGPWFRSTAVEDGKIRIYFDHTNDGLEFKGPTAQSFAVAGKDRKFVWAEAIIDGDTVVVSSPEVPQPIAVRYAWDSNPEACLYNGAGLPAVPFRSDDWPGTH